MRLAVFSTRPHDRLFLEPAAAAAGVEVAWVEARLSPLTAPLAAGADAVCTFVHDRVDAAVASTLASSGVKLCALRCAGFNQVDLEACRRERLGVARVPAYSPHAVAEHAVALLLTLTRRIHRAHNRVREGNFALDGLLGFDLYGKTVGVVGAGQIGRVFARIMAGFGCEVLVSDPKPGPGLEAIGATLATLDELVARADVISLHCPLTPETHHLIDDARIARMKPGVVIVNTGRGALIDTAALVRGLKSGKLGLVALDVYEEEEGLFFLDRSAEVIQDDLFMRLTTFPNVLITAHQGFFTREALHGIADVTIRNVVAYLRGEPGAELLIDARV